MDEVDKRILGILGENARMTIKEIAEKVSLTSPAVSERIRRMERSGVIAGYTVRINPRETRNYINAIIWIYVEPRGRDELYKLLSGDTAVQECLQVTGQHSHMVRVCCRDIPALDALINRLQKLGQTNTQIILSEMRGPGLAKA